MSKPVFEVGQVVRNKYLTQGTIIGANSDGTYDVVWATGDTEWFVEQKDIYVNSVQSSEELSITADLIGSGFKMRYGAGSGAISDPDTDEQEEEDVVNHPSHYTAYHGIEVIQLTEQMNFNRGNAVKYIARAGLKNPEKTVEDLEKAVWYINREIERLKGLE